MVAAGLTAIFFVCALVLWTIFTLIYSLAAAHYFLTTLTESSSGQDAVYFPREGFLDWWWKPVLCAWVLVAWLIPTTILLSPLLALSPSAYLITEGLILWLAFPLSLTSVLYAQNWLVLIHRGVIGRMLHHAGAYVFVNLITFALCAGCLYMVLRGMTDIGWLIPAIVVVPTVQLLYARHWGRFAWLSLNFLPRTAKKKRHPADKKKRRFLELADEYELAPPPELAEELSAEEVEAAAAEAFKEGPPPESAVKPSPAPVAAGSPAPVEAYDEWTDLKPYGVIGEEPAAAVEATNAPPPTVAAPKPPVVVEEEDEWATDKKPYAFTEPEPGPAPSAASETASAADQPLEMGKYYDERAKKEAEEKRLAEEAKRTLPARSKKTPPFHIALITGVWAFLFYPSTMLAWGNLAVFAVVELLLLFVLVMFSPFK